MFITAFASATLIPMGSEAVLLYNISQNYDLFLMFTVAVIGNTLGSYVNYYLGHKGEEYLVEKKHIKEKKIDKYKKSFNKYGGLILLLSWAPVIGDGITLVAGILRYNIFKFFLYVFISKFFRYLFIIFIFYHY